jgi:ATP-binding cassette subfamily F protein uup
VQVAEQQLAEARRRAEDPTIAADATALQEKFVELAAAQAEVDRLYARWSELEAKVSS